MRLLIKIINFFYEQHLTNKRHKSYEQLSVDRKASAPHLGTTPRTKETDYSASFRPW